VLSFLHSGYVNSHGKPEPKGWLHQIVLATRRSRKHQSLGQVTGQPCPPEGKQCFKDKQSKRLAWAQS